jgi:hypothetical protein
MQCKPCEGRYRQPKNNDAAQPLRNHLIFPQPVKAAKQNSTLAARLKAVP